MQAIMSDPRILQQIMASNPALANDPEALGRQRNPIFTLLISLTNQACHLSFHFFLSLIRKRHTYTVETDCTAAMLNDPEFLAMMADPSNIAEGLGYYIYIYIYIRTS